MGYNATRSLNQNRGKWQKTSLNPRFKCFQVNEKCEKIETYYHNFHTKLARATITSKSEKQYNCSNLPDIKHETETININ